MMSSSSVFLTNNTSTTVSPVVEAASEEVQLSKSDVIVIVVYVLIFALGTMGNLLVIRYFRFYCKSKHPYNKYLIHLAIADLLSSVITPIQSIYLLLSSNKWGLGATLCTVINVIAPLTVNASAWLLGGIAFERYRGIVSPLRPRCSNMKINVTAVAIWTLSLLTLVPYMSALDMVDGKCVPAYKDDLYELLAAIMTLVLQSIIPIIFMIFTVSRIFCTLQNRLRVQSPTSCDAYVGKEKNGKAKKTSLSISSFENGNPSSLQNSQRDIVSPLVPPSIQYIVKSPSNESLNSPLPVNLPSLFCSVDSDTLDTCNNNDVNSLNMESNLNVSRNKFFSVPLLSNFQYASGNCSDANDHQLKTNIKVEVTSFESLPDTTKFTSTTPDVDSVYGGNISKVKESAQMHSAIELSTRHSKKNNTFNRFNFLSLNSKLSARDFSKKKLSNTYKKVRNLLEHRRQDRRTRKQQQIILMLSVTFFVFVVCSLPYNIFYVTAIVVVNYNKDYSQLETLGTMNLWLSTLVVANSIMNCFIYAGMNREFRRNCSSLFNFCSKKKNKASTSIRTTRTTPTTHVQMRSEMARLLSKSKNIDKQE